jgi:PAS domain S-box-containing protein
MNKVILVVEDDPGLNKLICKKIEQSGRHAASAISGTHVVDYLADHKADLMLLDYQMPDMNGAELALELKEKGSIIPFIVITGHGDERIAVEMMKLGALDYIVKDSEFLNIFPDKLEKALSNLETREKLIQSNLALEESHKTCQMIIDSMPDPVYICSGEYEIQYANPALLNYIGNDIYQKKCYESIFNRKSPCPECKPLKSPDDRFTSHGIVAARDNRKFQLSSGPINFQKDTFSRLNILRDVSDLTEAKDRAMANEVKFREQHNMLRTLIDNMPDEIYVKDRKSRYIINNSAHQVEQGASSQEELIGKSDFDFFDKQVATVFFDDEQRIMDRDTPMTNKEEYVSYPDGSYRWNLVTKVPIKDEEGNITGVAGINRDITSRKEMEDELIRSRYELSIRNKIAGIFLTGEGEDVFHRVLQVVLEQLSSRFGFFGYLNDTGDLVCSSTTDELQDNGRKTNKAIVIPGDSWGGTWGRSMKERISVIRNQDQTWHDGNTRLSNSLSVPVTSNKTLLGLITVANKTGGYKRPDRELLEAICEYIAPILSAFLNEERMKTEKETAFKELVIAKEKAEETDRLKSAFLMNLSHEVRTPLNAIMGFTSLISQKFSNDENTAGFVKQIDSAGRDLMKMVDDTIDMAKLENRQIQIYKTKKDISKTMKEIAAEYSTHYKTLFPDISFIYKDQTGGLIVDTDHELLKKVIMKVLDNAIKFTEKGKVDLSCILKGKGSVVITVKDNGIGIEEKYHEEVFEKFRKVAVGNKVLYRGNGLGLSISKGIMELLGGSIDLESSEGKGTKIKLLLPVGDES